MSWTAPRTWTEGEVPTASNFNVHLRDNLLETEGAKVSGAGQVVRASSANALSALAAGGGGAILVVNSGATDVAWRSRDDVWPWLVDIPLVLGGYTAASSGWITAVTASTLMFIPGISNLNAGANSYVECAVLLAQGTWTLRTRYESAPDRGVLNFKLNGSSVGTQDAYNSPSTLGNQLSTITGIAVSASGKHTLRIESTTKNASSSSYAMLLQHIRLVRTA